MSKKERVKTILDTLKTAIFVFMTALFGLFGWAAVNHELVGKDKFILLGVIIGIVILSALCVGAVVWFFKELKRLEKM